MPEMSTKFVPKHKGDKNPNPKLLKLVRHITDRIPGKIKMDTDAPEYWGLACIFEDEMDAVTREAALDLMLDMLPGNPFRVRKHWTNAQLHELNSASKFNFYISDYQLNDLPKVIYNNKLPAENYTLTLVTDGSATYSCFKHVYDNVADAQAVHDQRGTADPG
jgi:hypothetical protein